MLAPKLGLSDLSRSELNVLVAAINDVADLVAGKAEPWRLVEAEKAQPEDGARLFGSGKKAPAKSDLAQTAWVLMLRGQHGGTTDDGETSDGLRPLFTAAMDAARIGGDEKIGQFRYRLRQRLSDTLRTPVAHAKRRADGVSISATGDGPIGWQADMVAPVLDIPSGLRSGATDPPDEYGQKDVQRLAPAIADPTYFVDRCRALPCVEASPPLASDKPADIRPTTHHARPHAPILAVCAHRLPFAVALAITADIRRAWSWAQREVTPPRRQAFYLHHVMDMTQAEAGRVLGKSGSAIGTGARECAESMAGMLNGQMERAVVDELAERRARRTHASESLKAAS